MQHGFRIRFYLIGDSTVLNMADGSAVGRPCIDVSKDDILVLKGLNYSWTKIADILGIPCRTPLQKTGRVQYRFKGFYRYGRIRSG